MKVLVLIAIDVIVKQIVLPEDVGEQHLTMALVSIIDKAFSK